MATVETGTWQGGTSKERRIDDLALRRWEVQSSTTARVMQPVGLTDDQVLFLTDIFPTRYMGAALCYGRCDSLESSSSCARRGISLPSARACIASSKRTRSTLPFLPTTSATGGRTSL